MKIKFENYDKGFKIVSLALCECTKEDLLRDEIDFIYVTKESIVLFPDGQVLSTDEKIIDELLGKNDYDAYELWPDGTLHICYDNSSIDNYFFVTGKCNSNCIMCPSPDSARKKGEMRSVETLIEIARHIPISASHLTITGGEPFIVGESIFDFLRFLKEKYARTEFLILTNGRIFAVDKYAKLLEENIAYNTIIAIPIHGSKEQIHDKITQVNNSFVQTLSGIKRLLMLGIRVELRLVVNSLNVNDFDNIVQLILTEIPDIEYVSVIAMEMTGSAHKNRDIVWIPYKKSFELISDGIFRLIKNGIDVKLYNFPLCTVDKKYWTLCEKSISPQKVKFAEVCEKCLMREMCGGIFAGTYLLEKEELEAIV